jgi:hypothetical protein
VSIVDWQVKQCISALIGTGVSNETLRGRLRASVLPIVTHGAFLDKLP